MVIVEDKLWDLIIIIRRKKKKEKSKRDYTEYCG